MTENRASSVELQHLYSNTKFTLLYFFSITICDGIIFLFQEEREALKYIELSCFQLFTLRAFGTLQSQQL